MSEDSGSGSAEDTSGSDRPARPTFIAAEEPEVAPSATPAADRDAAPSAAPAEEPEAASRRWWFDRRLLAGGGAAVAILLVVAVALFPREPEGPGPREELNVGSLAVPKATRDPVPHGPNVTKQPKACGVSDATARELVPGSGPGGRDGGPFADASGGSCFWYSLNDGEVQGGFILDSERLRKERVLNVDIELIKASLPGSPIELAMQRVDHGVRAASPLPRIVAGLGDDARAGYSPALDAGASVRFHVGNAAVSVQYDGWDRKGKDPARRQLSEKTAMTGALKAAAEIAKSLGVPTQATPSFVLPQATDPLIRQPPKPCDTVSDETLRRVANGAHRERGDPASFLRPRGADNSQAPTPVAADTCRWSARTPIHADENGNSARNLEVTIATVSDRQPGTAFHLATREYLRQHLDARDGERDATLNAQQGFTALTGLGDQAFAVYGKHPNGGIESPGRVVFRLRNVLVQVRYYHAESDEENPLTPSEAINGAYTAALDVAKALARS